MKRILGRALIVIPAVFLQLIWYFLVLAVLDHLFQGHLGEVLSALFSVLAIVFVTSLVAKRDEGSYKMLWVMLIIATPILGAMLYFFWGNKGTGRKLKLRLQRSAEALPEVLREESQKNLAAIKAGNLRLGQSLQHASSSTGFPVLKNETARYYPLGEDMFRDMCEDLKKAEKYIYIEYFIIEKGVFWNTLTDILAERAAAGVDVRVIYDDLGSIGTYSMKDALGLAARKIKCVPFNPVVFLRPQLNNRDHRKIMVIDGEVAYSGGVNLADEYINEVEKCGHWKDIGFRLTGPAVRSYTYMFAEFWNAFSGEKIDFGALESAVMAAEEAAVPAETSEASAGEAGYVFPYYDSPVREEHTSNELFLEVLSLATDYVWFYTPYLILGDSLFDALIRAARRGVDVRIVMPGVPDKKIVYRLSRSYYTDLLKAGVRIFEYTPGFVHAKAFLADDVICGIGTVNLDYRSLFLHFECSSVFYEAAILKDLKADHLATQEKSRERFAEDVKKGPFSRFADNVLRIIAPLM
ncbi:MAG: cardiolipin synthase [Lachnospiraceae bacterium]|nr:cardiolipin synthase [Lachnospiraceae bacterium]